MTPPPMSNAERQRQFQASHPGYDARRKARERAGAKRIRAAVEAEMRALAEAERAAAASAEPPALPEPAATPAPRVVLMLPAPAEVPVLPGLNVIARTPAADDDSAPQPLRIAAMRAAA